jgi:hypothetical protein
MMFDPKNESPSAPPATSPAEQDRSSSVEDMAVDCCQDSLMVETEALTREKQGGTSDTSRGPTRECLKMMKVLILLDV